jgi:8-hydroxy-5-deazaflavin:NADPH oxidoreductase
MNIGIIGAGNMGTGMGKFWAKNGHKLMFSYSPYAEKKCKTKI